MKWRLITIGGREDKNKEIGGLERKKWERVGMEENGLKIRKRRNKRK